MRLNLLQSAWLLACAALFALMLLDVVDYLEVPSLYWLACSGLLLLAGQRVMPLLDQIGPSPAPTRRPRTGAESRQPLKQGPR